MRPFSTLIPLVAGLLIALTYLLIQATAPDATRHERTLDALRTVILYNAALQRDVLRARTGLLRSYDPLVQSLTRLRQAGDNLTIARDVASGKARDDIDQKIAEVQAAERDQEALIEVFKSENALLQNSLSFFNHTSARMVNSEGSSAGIAALAAAMLRFVNDPQSDAAVNVTDLIDRIAPLPGAATPVLEPDVRSLISHGRLIVTTLPRVDKLVSQLQTTSTADRTRALEDAYLEAHGRAAARAGIFQALLYIAALILVAYIAYLFIRLRANAKTLRERLEFEELIASISTNFINLPRERIRENVARGLEQLVRHAGVDSAQILVHQAGEADFAVSYPNPDVAEALPNCPFEKVIKFVLDWQLVGYERQGCICVPDVGALPDSREKATLHEHKVRSWLCVPIWYAGERLGFLVLQTVTKEKHWPDDDIAQLRTATEIFAYAIARERNESEREALQARLNQSQRLEALGTLAGGIAHEFNNILGAMLGYGEMAEAASRKGSAARRYVRQILKAGERAQNVVQQVLAFGRRREREHKPIRAEPVVAEAIELIRASFPAMSIRSDLKAGTASIRGDPTELQQIVMNLGTNAAQAMNGRGALHVELEAFESIEGLMLSHGNLPSGPYVRLVVRDDGPGMDRATIERMFEPFFTTKPVGQGTGLGLSTVHGIVTQHGGAINVRSRLGRGTTFKVYFPQSEDAAAHDEEANQDPAQRGHGETILIVDDDKPLVLLGEEMLAALGYEPVGFDSSSAALAAFRADPKRFDLVLTDEVMPGITGTELAGACHQIRPDLPIILMTGSDRPVRQDHLLSAGIREVLSKPLLSRAIADSLARYL